jgi:ABC-type polysaccharide/polyol phosphate export permease
VSTPVANPQTGDVPALRVLITTPAEDLFHGLLQRPLYGRLGWLEMKRRYRRTVLGPLWATVSLAIVVGALGTIGVEMWNRSAREYIPFLAAGMIVWVLVLAIVNESCSVFIAHQALLRQMRINYSVLAYALVWRNLIAFFHNFGVYVLVMLIFAPSTIGWRLLLVIPGLALIAVNGVWLALLLGMACLRFRDLQQLTSNVVQIAIFVTPIFWPPEVLQRTRRTVFVTFNPLYHIIDVVRAPLIGRVPSAETYIAVLLIAAIGWTITYVMFSRYRRRIAYWS